MPLPATCAGDAVILRCTGIWMRRAALAALAAAAAAILLLSSCIEKIFPCEAEDLYGSWRTSDGKIQLTLDSNRSYSIQFENNKQRLVRASGEWEPATIDDGHLNALELSEFPVQERFHNDRYAHDFTSPAKAGYYLIYPQRKLSGSCVIIYQFGEGRYMEKEKPLSP